MANKLHNVIAEVLRSSAVPLSVKKIAETIREKGLWRRPKDNAFPKQEQISARINNYKDLFVRENGLVFLQETGNTSKSNIATSRNINERKITRISWNDKGWERPSGMKGKKTKDDFEASSGFGHEEWLFDFSKTINGDHYGFIEALHPKKNYHKGYLGRDLDIVLYTKNYFSNKRYLVGEIKDVKILTFAEMNLAYDIYVQNGWLDDLKKEVEYVDGVVDFLNWTLEDTHTLFNIRFKPEKLYRYGLVEIPDRIVFNQKERFLFNDVPESIEDLILEFSYDKEEINFPKLKTIYLKKGYQIDEKEIIHWHNKIQNQLVKLFPKIYSAYVVAVESPLHNRKRIDFLIENPSSYILVEVKTHTNPLTSIRQAIGQLLEYSFFLTSKPKEFLIITHIPLTKEAKEYTNYLREKYRLNVYYQYFDLITDELGSKQ